MNDDYLIDIKEKLSELIKLIDNSFNRLFRLLKDLQEVKK